MKEKRVVYWLTGLAYHADNIQWGDRDLRHRECMIEFRLNFRSANQNGFDSKVLGPSGDQL